MRLIDEKTVSEYGIPSLILMENAGSACAREAARLAGRRGKKITVLSGKGNNGGDGFVAARHLHNQRFHVAVFFFQKPSQIKPDPLTNFNILRKMGAPLIDCSKKVSWKKLKDCLAHSDVIVDALFGTGLSKPLADPFRQVVEVLNAARRPVVSVDIPSGLDADTGEVMGAAVRAERTVTLGFPKRGFRSKKAGCYTGKVIVADISIPKEVLENVHSIVCCR